MLTQVDVSANIFPVTMHANIIADGETAHVRVFEFKRDSKMRLVT
jgi:hypothetical protein